MEGSDTATMLASRLVMKEGIDTHRRTRNFEASRGWLMGCSLMCIYTLDGKKNGLTYVSRVRSKESLRNRAARSGPASASYSC
jgi:hypothetical protein